MPTLELWVNCKLRTGVKTNSRSRTICKTSSNYVVWRTWNATTSRDENREAMTQWPGMVLQERKNTNLVIQFQFMVSKSFDKQMGFWGYATAHALSLSHSHTHTHTNTQTQHVWSTCRMGSRSQYTLQQRAAGPVYKTCLNPGMNDNKKLITFVCIGGQSDFFSESLRPIWYNLTSLRQRTYVSSTKGTKLG